MPLIALPLPGRSLGFHAGVIEDARTRHRRERRAACATIVTLAAVVGAIVWASTNSGRSPAQHVAGASARPSQTPRPTLTGCAQAQARSLRGRPSKSLLAILGVLRRPATGTAPSPAQVAQNLALGVFGDSVYARYARRARVVAGTSYYVLPVRLSDCAGQAAHDGISEFATNVPLGHGLYGTQAVSGTASSIEEGREPDIGAPGSSTSTTVSIVVPDGVAAVTLHFAAGPANGFNKRAISPPYNVTARVLNNMIVVRVPRSSGTVTAKGDTMTWHAADGHTIKTFNRL
jgi:hypothetical protein